MRSTPCSTRARCLSSRFSKRRQGKPRLSSMKDGPGPKGGSKRGCGPLLFEARAPKRHDHHGGRKASVPRLLRTLRRKALLPLGLQGLTEGLKHQDHVVLRARRAHQSDARDLSFEVAEAAADLDVKPVEKKPADPGLIDAVRHL